MGGCRGAELGGEFGGARQASVALMIAQGLEIGADHGFRAAVHPNRELQVVQHVGVAAGDFDDGPGEYAERWIHRISLLPRARPAGLATRHEPNKRGQPKKDKILGKIHA